MSIPVFSSERRFGVSSMITVLNIWPLYLAIKMASILQHF